VSIITWLFTGVALYGTWLNSNQDREGFWWWVASDIWFIVLNAAIGQYALATLFAMYLILAIRGLTTWTK
jgi:nicotinamide riboside transporter PnuC